MSIVENKEISSSKRIYSAKVQNKNKKFKN